ncbi:MAG: metal-dependent hydrolase [Planctomycetota bacterium]|jgi:inner membrane protein|nr:metal-dependent hydrolase [Planctomycetota bacterium]
MDTITHGLLGATLGAALTPVAAARRKMALTCAVVAVLPDADLFFRSLIRHRAETHSFFYLALAAPLLALLAKKLWWANDPKIGYRRLLVVVAAALFSHPLLDLLNSFGTRLFLPFSDRLDAIDAIAVVDPLFSLPLLFVVVFLMFNRVSLRKIQRVAVVAALIWCGAYLGAGWYLGERALTVAPLQGAGLTRANPLIGTNLLWRCTQMNGREATVVYVDAWRKRVLWTEHLTSDDTPRTRELLNSPRLRDWLAHSGRAYVVKDDGERVYFRDLRHGMLSAPDRPLITMQGEFDAAGNLTGTTSGRRPFTWERIRREIPLIIAVIGGGDL